MWVQKIRERLTPKDVQNVISHWDGQEDTRPEAIQRLTEWKPVKRPPWDGQE